MKKVTFLPQNRCIDVEEGTTLLQAAEMAGVDLDGNCGGHGSCGKCKVKILSCNMDECQDPHGRLTEREKENGYRLACQHKVLSDLTVESAAADKTADRKKKLVRLPEGFIGKAAVKKIAFSFPATSLGEQESADDRVRRVLDMKNLIFTPHAIRKLPNVLKIQSQMTLTICDGRVLDLESGDTASQNYGVAVDIGTTTVVVMLWNLNTGEMAAVTGVTNPQGSHGADVISRISFTMQAPENLKALHRAIIDCINTAIRGFEETAGIRPEHIYRFSVVGNTTMSHIFMNVDPAQLAVLPFAPVFTRGFDVLAADLGLLGNQESMVHLSSNIAGHVGSDITAGILTTDMMKSRKNHLFIDIGTNGEMVLCAKGRVLACSAAAGPAFEGSSIRQGMRASEGAIERVDIRNGQISLVVIGDARPVGICGSGIIDAVGELIRAGVILNTGRISDPDKLREKGIAEELLCRIKDDEEGRRFVLYFGQDGGEDVSITQQDIRQVQLAKAAISAGMKTLMIQGEMGAEELDQISIAGAFGNYIRKQSAVAIGLLPKIDEEKIVSLGNSAGIGASMILLSTDCEKEEKETARAIKHIELATTKDFQREYITSMKF